MVVIPSEHVICHPELRRFGEASTLWGISGSIEPKEDAETSSA